MIKFFESGSYSSREKNADTILQYFAQPCVERHDDSSTMDILQGLCHARWKCSEKAIVDTVALRRSEEKIMSTVMKAALLHDRFEFFEEAASKINGSLEFEFFSWLHKWIGTSEGYEVRFERIRSK